VLAAAAVPASAPAAACSPLNCAASGTSIGNGLLAVRPTGASGPVNVLDLRTGAYKWRLPAGVLVGHTLVSQTSEGSLQWFDALTGSRTATATAAGAGGLSLVGVSQDGSRAVLQGYDKSTRQTAVWIVGPEATQKISLPTMNWGFDALNGSRLYLLRYLGNGGSYQIRLYDLAANKLRARPLKDPHASSTIWGIPWSRVASHDNRYLFTLYVGSNGATMVHELDLRNSTARCIDLPGTSSFNDAATYAIELSPDGRTLWAVSPGYGRAVSIDVRNARVSSAFRFTRASDYSEAPTASVSALSTDGSRLAVAVGGQVWLVGTAKHSVVKTKPTGALALGFSPDGTTLWAALNGELTLRVPLV
jgi:WD40 repeat protein